jgi:predicted nucleic acid-binding protein
VTPQYLLDTNILITLLRHGGSAQPGAPAAAATLVTNNRREFARVPGLAVEDWLADDPI